MRILVGAFMILLSACGRSVNVELDARQQLNLDQNGRSLPVLIKVYELRDKSRFEQASFDGLWQQSKETLGSDLLAEQSITVLPGAHKKVNLPVESKTNYIGFVAVFRKKNQNYWRVLEPYSWLNHYYSFYLHKSILELDEQ